MGKNRIVSHPQKWKNRKVRSRVGNNMENNKMATFTATTTAKNGHLVLCLRNMSTNIIVLTIKDSDTQTYKVENGIAYRVEWHFWSAEAAKYSISLNTDPKTSPFPVKHTFNYQGAHDDGNIPFTFKF